MANVNDKDDQDVNEDVEDVQPEQPETPDSKGQADEEVVEAEQELEDENSEQEIEQEEIEEGPKISRRAEKRIEKLDQQLKIRDMISSLKQQPQAPMQAPQGLDYGNTLEADPQVIAQLEADRNAYATQTYNQGLEQAKTMRFETHLEIDTPKVLDKYPYMNPNDSENFDKNIRDALDDQYLYMVGFNPQNGTVQNSSLRYADFIAAQDELASRMAGERVQRSTKNITRQAAQTGLRPDGSSAKRLNLNKAPEDMSIEELYAVTGADAPKKK